jgi:hypothetical protein
MRPRSLGRNTPSGSLLKRKIQVHIESLGGKAARDGRKLLRRGSSLRRKRENFSDCRRTAFLKFTRKA